MKNKRFVFLILPFFYLIVQYLKTIPSFVEQYYSNIFYPFIASIFRILFGMLPFSVGDVFIILVLFLNIREIWKLIRARFENYKEFLYKTYLLLTILYCSFYIFWGFNYFREPLSKKMNFRATKSYTTTDLFDTSLKMVKEINAIHFQLTKNDSVRIANPYTCQEMYQKASESYRSLSVKYHDFKYFNESIKSSLFSKLHSYAGTLGHLNPFTLEANINTETPKSALPFVVCHEIAHQIAWAPEEEANLVGFLATDFSNDLYFNY